MVKRQLTDEERKLTEKGTARVTEETALLIMNRDYNRAMLDKQKYIRDFDDKWRDYLRKVKDLEDEDGMKRLDVLIEQKEETIKTMQIQLKDGVDKPASV